MPTTLKVPAMIGLAILAALPAKAAPEVRDIPGLKALQSRVNAVVGKALPATVSLFSIRTGAAGSGVVVSPEGLVLTAGHVVRGVNEVTIVFPSGKEARGKVLGANYTRDSAMIRIQDPQPDGGWPYVEPGQSKDLAPGDLVIALGHAGGYDPVRTPPVRFGRVIARGPDQFFTTDCALIGGDSGGPLFDLDGRVIGIHSSIGVSLMANNHAGIEGFLQDWEKLLKGDTWGRLGGSSLLDNPDAPVLGIATGEPERGGMSIGRVFAGGPADIGGLRSGDIILTIDGKSTNSLRALHTTVASYQPGDTVKVRVIRGKDVLVRNVRLGRRGDVFPDNQP